MIEIQKSETGDTRSCDPTEVSKEELLSSSLQHIGDVKKGLDFFKKLMDLAAKNHDWDKSKKLDEFHSDFVTDFKETAWWDNHRVVNRHHLDKADGVPDDVNLVDVLEMIVDKVMAGYARTGEVYPIEIEPEILMSAFEGTVELLKANVAVQKPEEDPDFSFDQVSF